MNWWVKHYPIREQFKASKIQTELETLYHDEEYFSSVLKFLKIF